MPEQSSSLAVADPLLIPKAEAARLAGISERTVDRLVSCGRFFTPTRLGGRCLWNRQALIEWINAGCPRVADR
jgi:predicted DNA-binding transcriptional regulator AlpA